MRRNLLVVALALALVATAAPLRAGATARPHAARQKATVLLLGDSVLAALGFAYGHAGLQALSAYDVRLEAKSCRRLASPGCVPTAKRSALDVLRANRGTPTDVVVVAAGYNDGDIAPAVDAVMTEATSQGIGRVVWLTYRNAKRSARLAHANALLWNARRKWPQLVVADWDGVSKGKAAWFSDGVHLTPAGAAAMGRFIAAVTAQHVPS